MFFYAVFCGTYFICVLHLYCFPAKDSLLFFTFIDCFKSRYLFRFKDLFSHSILFLRNENIKESRCPSKIASGNLYNCHANVPLKSKCVLQFYISNLYDEFEYVWVTCTSLMKNHDFALDCGQDLYWCRVLR